MFRGFRPYAVVHRDADDPNIVVVRWVLVSKFDVTPGSVSHIESVLCQRLDDLPTGEIPAHPTSLHEIGKLVVLVASGFYFVGVNAEFR